MQRNSFIACNFVAIAYKYFHGIHIAFELIFFLNIVFYTLNIQGVSVIHMHLKEALFCRQLNF